MNENECQILEMLSLRPATCATLKVDPDCAAFCMAHDPDLPSQNLIAICARVAHVSCAEEQIQPDPSR